MNATQTRRSFREKWAKNPDAGFRNTLTEGSVLQNWILNRNGFYSLSDFGKYLENKKRILDGGCGNGRVTALLASAFEGPVVGVDLNAAPIAQENLAGVPNVEIKEGDLLGDLSHLGKFDFIYCQEVLHHTQDPRGGFLNLCTLLEPNGEIAIYVYRIKAPIREFADDFVRDAIKDLPYEEAMEASRQITELGKVLSKITEEIEFPEVKVLGIKAGKYTPQRFIYHSFLKCFWNDELSDHENVVINYDWYHPSTATRHTIEEVRGWFNEAGLEINHEFEDEYGITMKGMKK